MERACILNVQNQSVFTVMVTFMIYVHACFIVLLASLSLLLMHDAYICLLGINLKIWRLEKLTTRGLNKL